jgi:hypothetical protein
MMIPGVEFGVVARVVDTFLITRFRSLHLLGES